MADESFRVRRERCGIDAANGGSSDDVGRNLRVLKGHEHAGLIRATRATAGEHHAHARRKGQRSFGGRDGDAELFA